MKSNLIRCISVFLGILIASSLLSGAKVIFLNWYAFPEALSKFFVMLLCFFGVIKIVELIFLVFLKKDL
ncbi:hypothetical protein EB241_20215 [Erwinia psidii]|uniref:Uncharacterized protein n=1 Tax=Erwinia psidii TaxID=69224 RepID=A0A3N6SFZ5_9GAMM|nr:hypothetical protein EB241_20215 [Erwinia psidii]